MHRISFFWGKGTTFRKGLLHTPFFPFFGQYKGEKRKQVEEEVKERMQVRRFCTASQLVDGSD